MHTRGRDVLDLMSVAAGVALFGAVGVGVTFGLLYAIATGGAG